MNKAARDTWGISSISGKVYQNQEKQWGNVPTLFIWWHGFRGQSQKNYSKMLNVKKTLSKPPIKGKDDNFDKIFKCDTQNLKGFPIVSCHGLTEKDILKKFRAYRCECSHEGGKTTYYFRIPKATLSCICNKYGVCIKALLFRDY